MNYWLGCFTKYATFSGRARRKEYWMFILFNMLVAFGVNIVDAVLGMEGVLAGGIFFGGVYSGVGCIHAPYARYRQERLVVADRACSGCRRNCADSLFLY